jgi:hypothetical protein
VGVEQVCSSEGQAQCLSDTTQRLSKIGQYPGRSMLRSDMTRFETGHAEFDLSTSPNAYESCLYLVLNIAIAL